VRAVPSRESVRSSRLRGRASRHSRAVQRRSVAALSAVPLFDGLSRRHLRRLAGEADIVGFDRGRAIVEEGQAGAAMFVILAGSARVERAGRRVGGLVPGDFFGELSALDSGPRTASVVAETPLQALRLFRHTLIDMVRGEPGLVFGLLQGLARRLRQVRPGTPVV
jgi:CRP-like cAMP-binding protein